MEDLTIYEIVEAVNGSYGYPSTEIISSISTDTRTITKGSVFIALKGANFDGHNFAEKAIELGATAVISEKAIEGVRCIIVDDTNKALLDLAGYYRRRFAPVLVGITGSVGKTTTKEMTALVLSGKYLTLKTEGNLNNHIGLPHTLLKLTPEHKAAVIEMGMSGFGEISVLSQAAKPTIAVITNIGYSHIENLGSREGILKAKLEILDGASIYTPLVLNGDDDLLINLKNEINRDIVYYAIKNKSAEVYADNIVTENGETIFDIVYWGKSIKARLKCAGIHNVMNALASFCVGILAEIEPEEIVDSLAKFLPNGLRQSIVKKGEQTIIIDCYNASPDSMRASLAVLTELKPMRQGRRIAVLGDMLELGSMSKILHENVGDYVSESKADILICYGNNSRYIAEKAKSNGMQDVMFSESKSVIVNYLKRLLKPDDLVLFKASRGMKLEEVIEQLYE